MLRAIDERSRVLAVLGPTNTGKTHLAIERMMSHGSGIIGFPLRLLARENYDKIVRLKGAGGVALITGEEKILPAFPRYFVCTVESMPLDRSVDFLAVDEIQLCADPERGHVFTHRLLHARGCEETLFLGADTIRPLIRRLVPEAEFLSRPRFSVLRHIGAKKLTRLPRRSAVVTFSATEVYHTAELLRRQRGGTAVVLGALSPRTRNAQVAMYQAGEVDYLVATDAIGMGLNMDVDHVAFAKLNKFDGLASRRLRPHEIAQIAGRAGRHMTDGTFGTTADAGTIDEEVVDAVENHDFEPLRSIQWRNEDLDFRSPSFLLKSLDRRPPVPELRRAPEADDQMTLAVLARDPDISAIATTPERTRLLWDVCQIPDFRKLLSDAHTRLIAAIFRQLSSSAGRLDVDWVARQVARLDRVDGDIDTLVTRIAHTRTWTYVAYRADWLRDPRHWQEKARAIEDRLSDALHERLTQRFVDRRSATLSRSLSKAGDLQGSVTRDGEVMVEGQFVGSLYGFRFRPDRTTHGEDARAMLGAARRVLRSEIAQRVRLLESDDHGQFSLRDDATVVWRDVSVGRLAAGRTPIAPEVVPLSSDLLEPGARNRVSGRLQSWMKHEIAAALSPLVRLQTAELAGPARGLAYQLVESLGTLERRRVASSLSHLDSAGRTALAELGVVVGSVHIFMRPLMKPRAITMLARLWAVSQSPAGELPAPLPVPRPGAMSVVVADGISGDFYQAIGYAPAGRRAVRLDRLEALAGAVAVQARKGPFALDARLGRIVGAPQSDLPAMLTLLGYGASEDAEGAVVFKPQRPGRKRTRRGAKRPPDSPFARLRVLGSER